MELDLMWTEVDDNKCGHRIISKHGNWPLEVKHTLSAVLCLSFTSGVTCLSGSLTCCRYSWSLAVSVPRNKLICIIRTIPQQQRERTKNRIASATEDNRKESTRLSTVSGN